jgi:hypothetical protein
MHTLVVTVQFEQAHLQIVPAPGVCQNQRDCCHRLTQPLVISQDAPGDPPWAAVPK